MPLPGSEMLRYTVNFKWYSRRWDQKRICQGHVKNGLSEKLISETQRKMKNRETKKENKHKQKVQKNKQKRKRTSSPPSQRETQTLPSPQIPILKGNQASN